MTIIFSADDFGLTSGINEAVETAHVNGVLTQTSLMVAAPFAADAVARAARHPNLHVGLHIVLVDGDSLLGHARLPTITLANGRFPEDQRKLANLYFFSPAARRELRAEIFAQFEAYAATGLPLHHADCHKHFQLHPTIAKHVLKIGKFFNLPRLRIPAEPPWILRRCGTPVTVSDYALYAWADLLRTAAGRLAATDHVFGIKWSGHMTAERVQKLLTYLPKKGTSEIYFHPATIHDEILHRLMPGYEHEAELQTLLTLKHPAA
jgi:hopanoid biosynthesis associated protein HpnK